MSLTHQFMPFACDCRQESFLNMRHQKTLPKGRVFLLKSKKASYRVTLIVAPCSAPGAATVMRLLAASFAIV